jgi:hypothetical protein
MSSEYSFNGGRPNGSLQGLDEGERDIFIGIDSTTAIFQAHARWV